MAARAEVPREEHREQQQPPLPTRDQGNGGEAGGGGAAAGRGDGHRAAHNERYAEDACVVELRRVKALYLGRESSGIAPRIGRELAEI